MDFPQLLSVPSGKDEQVGYCTAFTSKGNTAAAEVKVDLQVRLGGHLLAFMGVRTTPERGD